MYMVLLLLYLSIKMCKLLHSPTLATLNSSITLTFGLGKPRQ